MRDELYCKIYVDGAVDVESLKATLADLAGSRFERRTIRTPDLEIDVFDQSKHRQDVSGDDFVNWPAYLEVFAEDGTAFDGFVVACAELLVDMTARGLRVVASCDFEPQLAAAMLEVSTRRGS